MNITIEKVVIVPDSCLKAFVDVAVDFGEEIGKIYLRGCRILQQPTQRAYLLPPQNQYLDKEGKAKYVTMAKFEGVIKEQIEKEALIAYLVQLKGGKLNGRVQNSISNK